MILHGMAGAGVVLHGLILGMILGVNGILQLQVSLPNIARRMAGEMIGGMINGEVTTGMDGVTKTSGAAVAGQIPGKKEMIGLMIGTRVMIGEVGARTANGVEEVANGEEEEATNGDGMTGGHILQLCRQRYHQHSTRRFIRPLRQPFR